MTGPGQASCVECGEDLGWMDQFCRGCGRPADQVRSRAFFADDRTVTPATVTAPVAPDEAPTQARLAAYAEPRPRRRWSVLAFVVTLVIVFAASVYIATRPTGTESSGSPTVTPSTPSAPSPSAPSEATSTTPGESSPGPGRACWDGTTATRCRPLTGVAALAWVFPGLAEQTSAGRCRTPVVALAAGKTRERDCTVRVGGQPVDFRYSEFSTVAASLQHYRTKRDDGEETASEGRLTWTYPPKPDTGEVVVSSAYTGCPFSFSVEAPDAATLDLARTLVRPRPAADLPRCG